MIISYAKRFTIMVIGLFLYALGIYFAVQACVGLAPWDAFHQGLSGLTGVTMGTVSIAVSVIVVIVDCLLKEKIGFGTILNALLIGYFQDLLMSTTLVPQMTNLFSGILLQLFGLFCIALGSYFYIGAGMGCGPRDGLMVALSKRFPNTSVGVIRGGIEGTVLIGGFLCGGTIGVGTVVAVFGLGYIVQLTFRVLHFDLKRVEHENVWETLKIWGGAQK